MATRDYSQGGHRTARRRGHRRHDAKSMPYVENDWPQSSHQRSHSPPRRGRHVDIETFDIGDASLPQHRPTPSTTPTTTTTTARTPSTPPTPTPSRPHRPRSASMRMPTAPMPMLARSATMSHQHRRPIMVYEEEDEDEDEEEDEDVDEEEVVMVARNGMRSRSQSAHPFRSRSQSRHVESRRALSPLSAHPFASRSQSRHSRRDSSPQSAHPFASRPQSRMSRRDASPRSAHQPASRSQSRQSRRDISPRSAHPFPSRSQSRQSRRDISPPSAHPYRSTPVSRRSPRTSVSEESDTETDVTVSSDDDDRAMRPHEKEIDAASVAHRSAMHERLNRGQEVLYEKDDIADRASVYAPSYRERQSPSHHASEKHDHYRRPHTDYHEASADDGRSRSRSKRPSPNYHESEVFASRPSSVKKSHKSHRSHRSHPTGPSHLASTHSLGSSKRSTFLGNFFGPSLQPQPPPEKPAKFVSCVVCLDEERPIHRTARLKCGHRMCHSCLKRNFKLSVSDPQNMPPKCCTADHIPLKHVERLFDNAFKKMWNKKFAEFSTRNRVYCPSRRCGQWIKPEDIYRAEDGRKCGRCSHCKTKVCCACNGKWHRSRECPRDEETNQFLEQAKREGWQRCYRCKAMVELKEGCNHMTCRCTAEFCMICGSKWKTCECPWFNFDGIESDPLERMPQVPMNPRSNPFTGGGGTRFGSVPPSPPSPPSAPSPRAFRSEVGAAPPAPNMRPRPASYESEDMLLRRLQEQHMAHRMHSYGDFEGMRDEDEGYGRDMGDTMDLGNHRGRKFMDEGYRRRPATVIVPSPPQIHPPAAPPPPHSTFEMPSSGMDYGVPGASWTRGVLHHSPERWRGPSPERRHPSRHPSPEPNLRRVPSGEKSRAKRNSSLDRRLAGRFNSGGRPGPLMPPMSMPMSMGGVMSPMGPMSPVMMPPHSHPHGHTYPHPGVGHPGGGSGGMPMAPAPPSAAPMPRMHMMEEQFFANNRSTRSFEQIASAGLQKASGGGGGAAAGAGAGAGSPRAPTVKRRPPQATREHNKHDPLKPSVLAGLAGPGRGMNRVFEWRNYVEPGAPEGNYAQSMAA